MLHSRCTDVDTDARRRGNDDVTPSSTHAKPRSSKPNVTWRIAKATVAAAVLSLGVVLVLAGLRELGLWFSQPAANCHGLCDWTTTHGPACPLIAVIVGGALFGVVFGLLIKSEEDEGDD
jgi:ribose/xylose/arabinose/galactoside ABC-type transport system permease subunit